MGDLNSSFASSPADLAAVSSSLYRSASLCELERFILIELDCTVPGRELGCFLRELEEAEVGRCCKNGLRTPPSRWR